MSARQRQEATSGQRGTVFKEATSQAGGQGTTQRWVEVLSQHLYRRWLALLQSPGHPLRVTRSTPALQQVQALRLLRRGGFLQQAPEIPGNKL